MKEKAIVLTVIILTMIIVSFYIGKHIGLNQMGNYVIKIHQQQEAKGYRWIKQ